MEITGNTTENSVEHSISKLVTSNKNIESVFELPSDNNNTKERKSNSNQFESNQLVIKKSNRILNLLKQTFTEICLTGSMLNTQTHLYNKSYFCKKNNKCSKKWTYHLERILYTLLIIIDVVLRGFGQVFLCNHPITGILISVGLYLTSVKLLIYAIVGASCSTVAAMIISLPPFSEVGSGLLGYDGALIGCAVCSFISADQVTGRGSNVVVSTFNSSGMAINAVLAAVSGVIHMASKNMNELPALTLSFNITCMLFLFIIGNGKGDVSTLHWGRLPSNYTQDMANKNVPLDWVAPSFTFFYDAAVRGVGQFMFINTTLGGWMVVIGIAIANKYAALASVCGALTAATIARYVLIVPKASLIAVHNGIYGYSAAGAAASIGGGVFYRTSFAAFIVGVFTAALTVFIQVAVEAILLNNFLQLPVLTIPFVATTWLIMTARPAWLDPLDNDDEVSVDVEYKSRIDEENNNIENIVLKNMFEKSQSILPSLTQAADAKKCIIKKKVSWKERDCGQLNRRKKITQFKMVRKLLPF
ncbi:urea transporter DVU1160-like [Hydra vulgaris]|uniref:Urea transporter DVU1160-like n=1 Tax=Hydra vulgaris TaxID=6087 RepID=A0ABM4BXC4_HYDVU